MSLFKKQSQLSPRTGNDGFLTLQTEINRLFNSVFNDSPFGSIATKNNMWTPHVDIKETNTEIIIAADIPGAKKEDIDISIVNNILSIKGERKFEENISNEKSHIRERFYGSFERSFSLPEGMINKENVSAEMNNGELIVKLQKLAETQKDTRKINIK